VVSSAHDVGIPTTSTMMFGHVDDDTIETRAAHLVAIRDAHLLSMCRKAARDGAGDGTTERRRDDSGLSQDSSGYDESDEEPLQQNYAYKGGFTEFVPLPFVHFEAPAFRNGVTKKGPTLRECLLVHAAARLVLGPAGLQVRVGLSRIRHTLFYL
jgi:2-iminoacetate synthase ThiH